MEIIKIEGLERNNKKEDEFREHCFKIFENNEQIQQLVNDINSLSNYHEIKLAENNCVIYYYYNDVICSVPDDAREFFSEYMADVAVCDIDYRTRCAIYENSDVILIGDNNVIVPFDHIGCNELIFDHFHGFLIGELALMNRGYRCLMFEVSDKYNLCFEYDFNELEETIIDYKKDSKRSKIQEIIDYYNFFKFNNLDEEFYYDELDEYVCLEVDKIEMTEKKWIATFNLYIDGDFDNVVRKKVEVEFD